MELAKIFDLQFWTLLIIGTIMVFLGGWILKNVIVSAVSKSVAEVVRNQWAQMFKKLDVYSEKVEDLERKYYKLKQDVDNLKNPKT